MKALSKLSPRRKEEILGLLMISIGVIIFFALISHSSEDDFNIFNNGGFAVFEATPVNWIGLVGAALAYLLIYLLGILAYYLPLYAMISGVKYLFRWKLTWLRNKWPICCRTP